MSFQQKKKNSITHKNISNSKSNLNINNNLSNNAMISNLNEKTANSSILSNSNSNILTNETYNKSIDETDFDFKFNASEDLIKKIEGLIARNRTLQEENNVLRNLISEENPKLKNVDEKRILMLKCQIYKLEKQVNILTKKLSFRKNAHNDVFNILSYLSDTYRSIIQNDENKNSNFIENYTYDKFELTKWIELIESAKIKLIKSQIDNENNEGETEHSMFNSYYSKTDTNILEICAGNITHINLKNVALLESSLSNLFKKLIRLKVCLKTVSNQQDINKKNEKSEILPFHKENLKAQLEETINFTSECAKNLFDLSLLIPSAPWTIIRESPIEKLTEEVLIKKLKTINLPKLKQKPVEVLIKSYCVASNYYYHMKNLESTALNEEIQFYRTCFLLQKNYIETLMNLFITKNETFINESKECLIDPLRIIVNKFFILQENSTEDNLKEFLTFFKRYAKVLDKGLLPFEALNNNLTDTTFNQLMLQLNDQICNLNKSFLSKLEKTNLDKIDLKELSLESDQLLKDFLKNEEDS